MCACSVVQSCWTLIHDMISRKKEKIEREGNKTEKKSEPKLLKVFKKTLIYTSMKVA